MPWPGRPSCGRQKTQTEVTSLHGSVNTCHYTAAEPSSRGLQCCCCEGALRADPAHLAVLGESLLEGDQVIQDLLLVVLPDHHVPHRLAHGRHHLVAAAQREGQAIGLIVHWVVSLQHDVDARVVRVFVHGVAAVAFDRRRVAAAAGEGRSVKQKTQRPKNYAAAEHWRSRGGPTHRQSWTSSAVIFIAVGVLERAAAALPSPPPAGVLGEKIIGSFADAGTIIPYRKTYEYYYPVLKYY